MRHPALPLLSFVILATLSACGGGTTPASLAISAAPSVTVSAAASAPPASTAGSSPASAAACATAPAGAAATVNVSIKNFKFSPQPAQAKVGDVVAWKNDDSASHSATMDDGSCDTNTISSGSSAMLVFTAPGTYTYHCKVHPTQMKDFTVEVK
jgi:plastocyanin